jgi:O-Antigen ligase
LTYGSFAPGDWLGYAAGCTIVLAVVLLAGAAILPGRPALAAAALLLALAVWTAISLRWSPYPSFARNEALLVAFYAVAFLIPLVSLRHEWDRLAATALVAAGLGSLAVAGALQLYTADDPENLYWGGRMAFPVSYPNALAALLLVGFWPSVTLAAERRLPVLVRALLLGGAAALLADFLLAQSKGGAVGLAVSGIVFFAVCPFRLRALVPVGIAAAVVAAQSVSLTEPYRASSEDFASAIQHGGAVAAVVAAVAAAVGLLYALLDRHVEVSGQARRVAAVLVTVGVVAGAGAGIAAFFTAVDHPGNFFADQWRSFKHLPTKRQGSTHFFSLGSNRYDFWRVALHEFEDHPVAGIGARGFAAAYLVRGRSSETPARAHSLEMDVLSETGIVGIVLLLGAGALLFVAVWPWARHSVVGAGILGAGAYFAVHTSVDWVWTIPEVGLPAFALLGIGASRGGGPTLRARAAIPAGAVALAVALLAFLPPWLSARFVDRAYSAGTPSRVRDDLRWARRLDPLSTDPLVAEATLARPPADIRPLERAVDKEPRRVDLRYMLGAAYLAAGRKAAARRQLREALRLYPDYQLAQETLARAR